MFNEFVRTFEDVFGKGELDITRDNFTNCGIQHVLTPAGYELSQADYISASKPIRDPELTGANPADSLNERLGKLFLSLLMVFAFCLQTRVDLAIYIVALQRFARRTYQEAEHHSDLGDSESIETDVQIYEMFAST